MRYTLLLILSRLMWYPNCITYKLCCYVLGCFRCLATHFRQKMRIFWLWYPLISVKNQLLILSFTKFLYTNKNEEIDNKNNYYYHPFNLTCLLTMSHSDFSKCRMIHTIEVWTKVLGIKCTSLYKNWLDIIILLFNTFDMTNTYLYSTH